MRGKRERETKGKGPEKPAPLRKLLDSPPYASECILHCMFIIYTNLFFAVLQRQLTQHLPSMYAVFSMHYLLF